MSDARSRLLDALVVEIGTNGLGDRSLRDLATAVGSSHRMLNYHFGSRQGLVAALVDVVEESQRAVLDQLASEIDDPVTLSLALWQQVSAEEMRPFVRLFFECVAATGGKGLTEPWLAAAEEAATSIGASIDIAELRLGIAVTRGLLIDVLATGDVGPATEAFERFAGTLRPHGQASSIASP